MIWDEDIISGLWDQDDPPLSMSFGTESSLNPESSSATSPEAPLI